MGKLQKMASTFKRLSFANEAWLKELNLPVIPVKKQQVWLVSWLKPLARRFKLNINGSRVGNPGNLGVGVVIQNSHGDVCLAFSRHLGTCSNNCAELQAMLIGLRYCCVLGIQHVDVESDSLVCVNWVRRQRCGVWYSKDFWYELMDIIQSGDFLVQHVYLEGNAPADYLAKLGAHGATHVW